MKLGDIRSIAKSHHIKPGHLSKAELIKSIQINEGNFDCFATACNGDCDQSGCLWRDDCFAASRGMALS
ncbi:MAG: SAP domain-containing protein [Nitrosomonadales bacterium]|nr:SAP domain-containing protein [Nitrosomonadales bacterium]